MNIHKVLVLILITSTQFLFAQNEFEAEIIESSQKMGDALVTYDYQTLADYTYPKIIEMMGGNDKMIEITENAIEQMRQQGFEFSKINFGKPTKIYEAGNELHSLLDQTIEIKKTSGTIISKSYLLAISLDKGERWYFLDTADLTNETVYELFPDFNSDLSIPEKKQPQFIPN